MTPADEKVNAQTVDPETGIRSIWQWGSACGRGFVRDSRFGEGQVIQGTNRAMSRKWRALDTKNK